MSAYLQYACSHCSSLHEKPAVVVEGPAAPFPTKSLSSNFCRNLPSKTRWQYVLQIHQVHPGLLRRQQKASTEPCRNNRNVCLFGENAPTLSQDLRMAAQPPFPSTHPHRSTTIEASPRYRDLSQNGYGRTQYIFYTHNTYFIRITLI